jgi:hypothetical protein
MKRQWIAYVFAAGVAITSAGMANAGTIALTGFGGGENATSGSDQLYGWYFNTSSAIDVTALGVGDSSGQPLSVSHDVGIFDVSTQALLGSATVPSGSGGTLENGFDYESVSPFELSAGSYVIVMTMPAMNADVQSIFNTSETTSAPVTYVNSAFDAGSSLAFPDPASEGAFAQGLFGPNFIFNSAVPEPATWAMLLVGLGGLGVALRGRRGTALNALPAD